MNHKYFYFVLLTLIDQFNGERSASAIYHLLKGKKSSQTIQDGKLFNLAHFFSLFPRLTRTQFNEAYTFLVNERLIELIPNHNYKVSEKGHHFLVEYKKNKPIPDGLDGWKYGDAGRIFWRRLSLLIQVTSNLAYETSSYIPVTKNQEDLSWVKNFLSSLTIPKLELVEQLYKELEQILSKYTNEEAELFVQRLTSSQKIGLTFEQIAVNTKEDPTYIYLLFWEIIHTILCSLQQQGELTILTQIIKDKLFENTLTTSTAITRSYLLAGRTVREIAKIRRLKESTIEDHIVEITLHDLTFIPSGFLSKDDYLKINHAITMLNTHKLKDIRENLNNKYSYFQIRLAYAMNGRNE